MGTAAPKNLSSPACQRRDSVVMARIRIATLLVLIAAGNAAQAQAPRAIALTPSEMVFSTAGLTLPGMGQVNLVGDPTKPGPYTVRLQFPGGYRIDAHHHPTGTAACSISRV